MCRNDICTDLGENCCASDSWGEPRGCSVEGFEPQSSNFSDTYPWCAPEGKYECCARDAGEIHHVVKIDGGLETCRFTDKHSCPDGMDIWVPRSYAHAEAVVRLVGSRYTQLSGIYQPGKLRCPNQNVGCTWGTNIFGTPMSSGGDSIKKFIEEPWRDRDGEFHAWSEYWDKSDHKGMETDFEMRGPFTRTDPDGSEGTSIYEDLKSYTTTAWWFLYEVGFVTIDGKTGEPLDIVHFGGHDFDALLALEVCGSMPVLSCEFSEPFHAKRPRFSPVWLWSEI
jgi:hypothetical protein